MSRKCSKILVTRATLIIVLKYHTTQEEGMMLENVSGISVFVCMKMGGNDLVFNE